MGGWAEKVAGKKGISPLESESTDRDFTGHGGGVPRRTRHSADPLHLFSLGFTFLPRILLPPPHHPPPRHPLSSPALTENRLPPPGFFFSSFVPFSRPFSPSFYFLLCFVSRRVFGPPQSSLIFTFVHHLCFSSFVILVCLNLFVCIVLVLNERS